MSDEAAPAVPQAPPPPAPEPEAPSPSWLAEGFEQKQQTQFVPGYEPQYMQPAPAPRGPDPEELLRDFVKDPSGFLARRDAAILSPMKRELEQLRSGFQSQISNSLESARRYADNELENGYKNILGKDKAFVGNPEVRKEAERVIKSFYYSALERAKRTGNTDDLEAIGNPDFFDFALMGAKKKYGYPFEYHGQQQTAPITDSSGRPSGNRPAHGFDQEVVDRLRSMGRSEEDLAKGFEKFGQVWSK